LYSNSAGNENCAFGTRALRNTTGSYNVGMGTRAMYSNTSGEANIAIGSNALYYLVSGNQNTAVGNWAGPSSTSIALSNTTALGNNAIVTANNSIHLGDVFITEIAGQVGWSTYSDKRFKNNVKNNVHGLDFIMKLEPVTYTWDIDKLNSFLGVNKETTTNSKQKIITYTGFLAQDVEKAALESNYDFSGVVHPQNDQSIYSIRYAEFVVPLVKAVQEQQEIIDKQNQTIEMLIKRIEQIENSKETIKR